MKKILKTIPAILLSLVVLASSSFALNTVSLSPEYFANPTIGRPIANAQIYVGIVDLDPEVPANQKQLSVLQENGSILNVPQPISTGAGGVPEYNGSPVTMLVDGSYSIKVLDSLGSQLYYVPKNAELVSLSSFDNILDMRAITATPADGDVYTLLGYYTPGDGGGGQFYWDATSTATDNGGTIIKVTSITTGRWIRLFSGSVTAKQFGARLDGIQDDVAFINNALVAMAGTGIHVVLDVGTASISEPIVMPAGTQLIGVDRELSIIAPDSPSFSDCIVAEGLGEGIATTLTVDALAGDTEIILTNAAGISQYDIIRLDSTELLCKVSTEIDRYMYELVRVKSVSGNNVTLFTPLYFSFKTAFSATATPVSMLKNVVVKNLQVKRDRLTSGAQGSPYTYGIRLKNVENGVVENVKVTETTYLGVHIQQSYNSRVSDSVFLNCEYPGTGTSYGTSVDGGRDTLIENNYYDGGRHCISIGGADTTLNVRVVNCVLNGNADDNFAGDVHIGAEVVFENCRILGGIVTGPPSVSIIDCDIVSNGSSSCVGTRGIASHDDYGRQLTIRGGTLTWNGATAVTGRGPVYISVADTANNSIFLMDGVKIWNYAGGGSFDVGLQNSIVENCVIKSQNAPIPLLTNFYSRMNFKGAAVVKCRNNYIEGGITRTSTQVLSSLEISGNTIYNSGLDGIEVSGDTVSPTSIYSIDDNTIMESRRYGINAGHMKTGSISGNKVIQTHADISYDHYGIWVTNPVVNLMLTENMVYTDTNSFLGAGSVTGVLTNANNQFSLP